MEAFLMSTIAIIDGTDEGLTIPGTAFAMSVELM
jgi:hypothetical protein